ncbi:MAG: hypothetical protein NTY09_14485 [bacterium]|nr:hypothetical protein [bacterium]
MTEPSSIFHCTACGASYDPELRFCTKCGAKLPPPTESEVIKTTEASGKSRGIEPPPDALYEEPSYISGHGSQSEEEAGTPPELKFYSGSRDMKDRAKEDLKEKVTKPPPANSFMTGFLLIVAFIAPPAGLLTAIAWALMPSYRKAVVPVVLASIMGAGIWGWVAWGDMKKHIYEEPLNTIEQYIEAQDLALSTRGHFLSLLNLQIDGYLPTEFPATSNAEFEFIEHVLGPTGYSVEIRPGFEESKFFRMESLWTDQSGQIRRGSNDGPILER